MSILDVLRETKRDNNNLEELAALPQALIMQMAQNGQIEKEMLMPILGKKAEMVEKTAKLNAAKQLAAQGGQTPTVMDNYMSTIAQAENPMPPMPPQQMMPPQPMPPEMMAQLMPQGPADVGIASNPVPPMQMAGGGIIAFDDGGDVDSDDDYQESVDDANEAAMNDEIFQLISELKPRSTVPMLQAEDVGIPSVRPTEPRPSQGGIKDLISEKAAKYNLPPELMYKIAGAESGGKASAANPNSSAKGVFQFIDTTWKGMGGKPGEQFDPEQNTELGAKYIRQNAEGLKDAFGRNPTYGEIYAAHHFGLKGAKDLLSMDPRTPMENAVSDLVLKQNPQLKGRTVGQVMAGLNRKTGEGIVSLARGGEVQHYARGGESESDYAGTMSGFETDPAAIALDELRIQNLLAQKREKELADKQEFLRNTAPQLAQKVPVNVPVMPSTDAQMEADQGKLTQPTAPSMSPLVAQLAEQPQAEENPLIKFFNQRQAKIDAAEKRDEAMAMLAGSLGILGGDSPYFGVNIGRGAQQGVQQLGASQKLRASQEAALNKLYGSATQSEMLNKLRQETLGFNKERDKSLNLDKARDNLRQYLSSREGSLEKRYPEKQRQLDENMLSKYNQELNAIKLDPEYRTLYREAYPSSTPSSDFKLVGKR